MSTCAPSPQWPYEHLADQLVDQARQAAPGRTATLVSIRVAQLLGAGDVLDQFEPDLCAAVRDWSSQPNFDEAERAVLTVTEQFVIDVHGLDNDTFGALLQHYSPTDVMGILVHLAVTDGFTKRHLVFPEEPLPEHRGH